MKTLITNLLILWPEFMDGLHFKIAVEILFKSYKMLRVSTYQKVMPKLPMDIYHTKYKKPIAKADLIVSESD
jgi:hypothetical protein